MEQTTAAPVPAAELTADDVETCVRVLRAIEADRSHLTRLSQDQRRELLTLAGLVAKPERHDLVSMAKAFRRAEREAAKEQDRKAIEQAGLRVQRRSRGLRAAVAGTAASRKTSMNARGSARSATATSASSPLRRCIATTTRCASRVATSTTPSASRAPTWAASYALVTGARVKIGYQASLKLLRAGAHVDRHDALSGRCRRPLFEGAGFRRVPRAAADPRAGPAPHAERGAVHEIPRRAAAAPRLHPQQRVPDGAPAGGILRAPAGAGSRADRRASGGPAIACSRAMTSCTDARRTRARSAPARSSSTAGTRARRRAACTAPRSRSAATSTRTTAAARRCFPRIASTRTGSRSTCAR